MDRDLELFFNNVLSLARYNDNGLIFNRVSNAYPYMDIYTKEDETLVFRVALAGYKKENITVEMEDKIISISGKCDEDIKAKDFILNGIKKVDFERRFTLPKGYTDEVSVEFKDGILLIEIKKSEDAKKKLIAIK